MLLDDLVRAIGYAESPFYRESSEAPDLSVAHLLRDAKRADVQGTYFFRTAPGDRAEARERPAVHVAEAKTISEARAIHRRLWNQGVNPFLLILLPHQIRVYTGFEFDPDDEKAGLVGEPLDTGHSLATISKHLSFLSAESIDSGVIWQLKGHHLKTETRVDQELLKNLKDLSGVLVSRHRVRPPDAHAIIGKFVYLHYLKDRDILSTPWMRGNGVDPASVFSPEATLSGFRRLCDAVDERFNGNIFPIHWSGDHAPSADAVKEVARAFAGEEPRTGQRHLPFRAYDFSFIPIELLSAIYEQFLHDQGRKVGAFYTPQPAADYLIAELDSVKKLEPSMKILDPCCGSGIFLVLAYRRLIELERQKRKDGKLAPRELRDILLGSIYGVERNHDACLVTEFSLILTLLSYVDPPELHRSPASTFKFPDLHNDRIFEADFFNDESGFARSNQRFDWIVGNPPWMEIDPTDLGEQPAVKWIKSASTTAGMPVARYRAAEAFSWRVRDRLAEGGTIALFIQASSLTNAQSKEYRRAFFSKNTVHRITNFSNFAYVLFPSAEEPAATVVYSLASPEEERPPIIHYGPLLANQLATQPGTSRRQRSAWSVTICENEIQTVPSDEAAEGRDLTWKFALWGNHRDRRIIERIKRLFPDTLGDLAERKNWNLSFGLQLRKSKRERDEQSEHEPSLEGLKVLTGDRFVKSRLRFEISEECLEANVFGTFIRKRGGRAGLSIIKPPHLFLWTDFAAFSQKKFIFRERKIGLSAPPDGADFLRAISVLWASSVIQYFLFFLSSSWGLGRSVIDLEDARAVPLPKLSDDEIKKLAGLHRQFVEMESREPGDPEIQSFLDRELAALLSVPPQVALVTKDFVETRLRLIKGNAPRDLTQPPTLPELETYAKRLASELDDFVDGKGRRHLVSVLKAGKGIVATVEIVRSDRSLKPVVNEAEASDAEAVGKLLQKAGKRHSQWAYVQRGVRVFAGHKIHLCKLPRRLDWTETQALLDSDDIIAEVLESRGKPA